MRSLLTTCLAVLLLTVAAPLARAAENFVFIHASDTHFADTDGPGSHAETNALMYSELSELDPKPAFVITTGDICEYGTDAEYAVFNKTIEQFLTIPHYETPGNHDVRWNPRGKEGYTRGVNQPLFQSWDHGGIHFVTLDSCVLLEHWGHISQEQLDWLKQDLDRAGTETPVVIGFHHWLGRDTVQVDNEAKLMELVKPYNVRLWLQGHGHSDIQWNVNGTPAIMCKGLYQGSYNLIEVKGDHMVIKRRALGKPDPKNELTRDKSVPAEQKAEWTELMTVPLARQVEPKWQAEAKFVAAGGADRIEVVAQRGDLPDDAKVEYRVDSDKYAPMKSAGDTWTATLPTKDPATGTDLVAGEHLVTVQATLPDGRQYQQGIPVNVKPTSGPAVAPAWSTNIHGAVQSRLVRAGDWLYVTSMGNDLVAIDPKTGKEGWRFRTGGSLFSTPAVHEDTVYFGSADHHVYAVDVNTRELKWRTKTEGAVFGGPAVAQGVVCVASVDTKIYGLDAKTGDVKWTVQGGNMFQSQTATDGLRFVVGGWDNTVRCIDALSGNVNWEKKVGKNKNGVIAFAHSPAIAHPTIGGGLAYVTSNDGVLHAFNLETGEIIWQFDNKNLGYSGPLYLDGKVYVAISDKGDTFCLDARTGEKLWTCNTGSVIYDSSFAGRDGKVYIGCVNGVFNAIDAQTGKMAWQYRLGPGHLLASPVVDAERVYIGNMAGLVVGLPARK